MFPGATQLGTRAARWAAIPSVLAMWKEEKEGVKAEFKYKCNVCGNAVMVNARHRVTRGLPASTVDGVVVREEVPPKVFMDIAYCYECPSCGNPAYLEVEE